MQTVARFVDLHDQLAGLAASGHGVTDEGERHVERHLLWLRGDRHSAGQARAER